MGVKGLDSLESQILEVYTSGMDSITAQVMEAAKERANECKNAIQQDSPSDSSEYKQGWVVRKTKNGYIVYNKNRANIEMPLEHGHIIARGKYKGKRAKAYPHIYKNADKARDAFVDDCTKIVKKGGN